jgi:Protein of unknown function (DUF2795)
MAPDAKVRGAEDKAKPVTAAHAHHAGGTAAGRTALQFECAICGEGFSKKAAYERHLAAWHLPPAAAAATVEHALAGIDLPATKQNLVSHAERGREPEILALLKGLPARRYRDAADVAVAIGELKGRHPRKQPRRRQA